MTLPLHKTTTNIFDKVGNKCSIYLSTFVVKHKPQISFDLHNYPKIDASRWKKSQMNKRHLLHFHIPLSIHHKQRQKKQLD